MRIRGHRKGNITLWGQLWGGSLLRRLAINELAGRLTYELTSVWLLSRRQWHFVGLLM